MATEIDRLEVKITSNANDAAKALSNMANALKDVRRALSGTKKDGDNLGGKLSKNLNDLANAINTISLDGIKKLNQLSSALNRYTAAVKGIKGVGGANSGKSIAQNIAAVKQGLATTTGGSADVDPGNGGGGGSDDGGSGGGGGGDINTPIDAKWKPFKAKATWVGKFLKSIGRIAMYRAIRSAMKAVAEAFSEGLKNAYMYSKQSESFTRLAETMDRIKSVTAQMVNQLGAFWGEVKQLMLPVIEWVVEKVRAAAEWLTEFFAALNGETTYLYANYVYTEWEKATDAVKEYKHQLLGLDELNVLSSNKTKDTEKEDYSKYYEEKNVRDSWLGLSAKMNELKLSIGKIIPDFGNLTGDDVENILIVGLSTLTGGLIGGVPGAIVGTLAGILLTLGIETLTSDNGNKSYSKKGLFKVLRPALYGLAGAFIGFTSGGIKGALIGMSIGTTVGLVLEKLSSSGGDKSYSKKGLFKVIKVGLSAITGGIIGYKVGGIKGALLGMTTGATLELVLDMLSSKQGNISYTKKGIFNLLSPVLGGLVGGIIGFYFGGASGAVFGALIGVSLTLLIQDIEWEDAVGEFLGNKFLKDPEKEKFKILNALSWITSEFPGISGINIFAKASGGVVPNSSLFYAGEAGPEFVGSIGNTSAVANTEQMTEAIYKAAYMGMSKALKENGNNGMNGFVPATTDDLFIAMRKKASNYNKRTGESAFA